MKLVSLTVLHYGREWLEWALAAIDPFMDEMHIFYSPHPSHGTRETRHKCPDTRQELFDTAAVYPSVHWHDVDQFWYEGEHRDYARAVCEATGADLILVVDADEVWDGDDLESAIEQAYGMPGLYKSRIRGNLWKGVNWVCRDELQPDRIIVPGNNVAAYLEGPGFWHFGYAVSMQTMLYKLSIHGHIAELRQDWKFIYQDWKGPQDTPRCGVHPTNGCDSKTGRAFWTPEPFDRQEIYHLVGDHPYFKDELV